MRPAQPETLKLKPAEGCRVRKPDTGELLADSGELLEVTPFWRRRLDDGDVVEVETAAEAPKPAKKD